MSKLTNSPMFESHFVPKSALPGVSVSSSVADTLRTFQASNVGGALLFEGKQAVGYVRGDELHAAILEQSTQESWDFLGRKSVTDVLRQSGRLPIPVRRPDPNADAETLNKIADFIVFEVEDEGRTLGWFLNHEDLRHTVQTKPPVFICERGHVNADPDHGFCGQCPAKLKA